MRRQTETVEMTPAARLPAELTSCGRRVTVRRPDEYAPMHWCDFRLQCKIVLSARNTKFVAFDPSMQNL